MATAAARIFDEEKVVRNAETEPGIGGSIPGDREDLLQWTREHLVRENISIAELARRIRYEPSNLSKYLSGTLDNVRNMEAALRGYRARAERLATDEKFYETRIARKVMSLCAQVADEGLLGLAYGGPEIGKTVAVKEFLRRRADGAGNKVAYVQVKATDTTKSVMDAVARQLGIRRGGSTPVVMDLIHAQLLRAPRMIALDDSNYLSLKAIEAFRWIWDNSGSGLLLMGTPALYHALIEAPGRQGEELRQFRSRVDVVEAFLGAITAEERREIAKLNHSWMGKKDLDLIETEQYQPRKLDKILRQVERLRKANPALAFEDLLARAKKKIFEG